MLAEYIPDQARLYIDNVRVKGPCTYYNYKEVTPGICWFVLEHIQNLDQVLEYIERAGATIRPKSQYCMPGLRIVGFVTNTNSRRPDTTKIVKILE
jgi:hypothetical protein